MIVGYARTCCEGQELDRQIEQLKAAGCEVVHWDVPDPELERDVPAKGLHLRPMAKLNQILYRIGDGDMLVVCRLDRLGRSLSFIVELMNWLPSHGASFRSLAEEIDTASPDGMPVLMLTRALENAAQVLAAEQSEPSTGKQVEPKALSLQQVAHGRQMRIEQQQTMAQIATVLGVDRQSLIQAGRGHRPAEPDR